MQRGTAQGLLHLDSHTIFIALPRVVYGNQLVGKSCEKIRESHESGTACQRASGVSIVLWDLYGGQGSARRQRSRIDRPVIVASPSCGA